MDIKGKGVNRFAVDEMSIFTNSDSLCRKICNQTRRSWMKRISVYRKIHNRIRQRHIVSKFYFVLSDVCHIKKIASFARALHSPEIETAE